MTQRFDGRKDTVIATTAITRFRFISRAGAQGTITAGNNAPNAQTAALGVALHDAAIGEQVAVVIDGTAQIECAGAIAQGVGVMVQADGRILTAAPTTTVASMYSKTATTAAGQLAEVDITRAS